MKPLDGIGGTDGFSLTLHERSHTMNMVATTIETLTDATRMVYHRTCVASYSAEVINTGKDSFKVGYRIELNHGGYMTKTTKKRMNQFAEMFGLPFRVQQVKGDWLVVAKDTEGTNKMLPFMGNTCNFTVSK